MFECLLRLVIREASWRGYRKLLKRRILDWKRNFTCSYLCVAQCSAFLRSILMPIRYYITGLEVGASIEDTLHLIGREETRTRLVQHEVDQSNYSGLSQSRVSWMKCNGNAMLGPRWTDIELVSFYRLVQTHAKDYESISEYPPNRSIIMTRALYAMHSTYLSLSEASANCLCAIMNDYYKTTFPTIK